MFNLVNKFKCSLICLFVFTACSIHLCDAKKIKIAFWINVIAMRGTQVATYDYADYNETILGNESIILNNLEFFNDPKYQYFKEDYNNSVSEKFLKRFPGRFFDCANMQEAEEILKREKVDIFYAQKGGTIDNNISKVCKNAVHAVFTVQPHGQAYACISNWLISKFRAPHVPVVPYLVRVDSTNDNLRSELGIPEKAIVFGRHGGLTTFDVPYAQPTVTQMAQEHPEWYFVFLNTPKFCDLKNVIFLPGTADMVYKTKFINTCDAMIHARKDGETFGLAVGEFSIKNKPVISCYCGDLAHIEILGNRGFYYHNKQELIVHMNYIAENIDAVRASDWDCYSKDYSPEVVMKKFDQIFIQPLL